MYPEPGNPAQGWGLSFFLHLQDSMVHSKGTGWWAGLAVSLHYTIIESGHPYDMGSPSLSTPLRRDGLKANVATQNLFWWADRNRGIGGMIASQVVSALPRGFPSQAESLVSRIPLATLLAVPGTVQLVSFRANTDSYFLAPFWRS
jgi:hypothetical protein